MDLKGKEGRGSKADVNHDSESDPASERLCTSCNTFPFEVSGFYGSVFDTELLKCRQLHKLPEVLDKSGECFLCRKIIEFFHEWSGQKFGKEGPDLQNASVALHLHLLDSKDDGGNSKGGLVRIRVFLLVPNPSDDLGDYNPVMEFQRCSQPLLEVEEFCKRQSALCDWGIRPEQAAYSGRIRPLDAKTHLFRKWKDTCCDVHGNHCDSFFTKEQPIFSRRFIDVQNMCVIDSEDVSKPYTALSYVWGKAKLPQLTTKNRFQESGSLTRETLLSTIEDAIEVTRILGYQYIWIDCLCIMQDDEADKREFIPKMDLIFGSASVVIVAASGVDANAGLPGIKANSRTCEQKPFTVKGVPLVRTLDPAGLEGKPSYLAESVWNRRGWTFQEKIFSRRALIFTEEQVYWECQKATWCEDGVWESMQAPTVYRHSFAEEDFRHPSSWISDVHRFERIYPKLVKEYSGRKLTFESDGLNAFEGIVNAFRKEARQDILCALPISFLSNALTWHCSEQLYKRRKDEKRRSSDGNTTGCRFPSWSWVGWVGEVEWLVWEALIEKTHLDLTFYYLDDKRSLRQVEATGGTESLSQISVKVEADTTTVTLEDVPETIFRCSIPSNVLFFWSSTAKLLVKYGEDPDQPILCHNRKNGQMWTIKTLIWTHTPSPPPNLEELGEFVVIGKCAIEGNLAVLFLTPENKDGVVYRQGLVYIALSDWVALDNRVWKMISLS